MEDRIVDGRDGFVGFRLADVDRVPVHTIDQTTDVRILDGPFVPGRLGRIASIACADLLRMDNACRPADAAVRIRPDAAQAGPKG